MKGSVGQSSQWGCPAKGSDGQSGQWGCPAKRSVQVLSEVLADPGSVGRAMWRRRVRWDSSKTVCSAEGLNDFVYMLRTWRSPDLSVCVSVCLSEGQSVHRGTG